MCQWPYVYAEGQKHAALLEVELAGYGGNCPPRELGRPPRYNTPAGCSVCVLLTGVKHHRHTNQMCTGRLLLIHSLIISVQKLRLTRSGCPSGVGDCIANECEKKITSFVFVLSLYFI